MGLKIDPEALEGQAAGAGNWMPRERAAAGGRQPMGQELETRGHAGPDRQGRAGRRLCERHTQVGMASSTDGARGQTQS